MHVTGIHVIFNSKCFYFINPSQLADKKFTELVAFLRKTSPPIP